VSAATAEPSRAIRGPGRRLLLALLVISGVLNFFFVGGAVWTRLHPPAGSSRSAGGYQLLARKLDLDRQQRSGFDKYVAAMRDRDQRMHQQLAPLIAGAWEEVAKPQADVGQVMHRFDAASEKWREFQREATVQTLDFLSLLSPEQRGKFIAFQRERRAAWQRRNAKR